MDPREKATHAQRLLDDPIFVEVCDEAYAELTERVMRGETSDEREDARLRYLGIEEIRSRLQYLTSELEMPRDEEEEDADSL